MNTYRPAAAFLLLLLAIYTAFSLSMPAADSQDESEGSFSTARAMQHVAQISQHPHAVGFPAHRQVREYLIRELQLLGLETRIQEGHTAGDWGNFSKATNILARIQGSGTGPALLLLSHYDSSPHSALGASDAGSGVATILEGLRAFLSSGAKPVNDIVILFSDGEELGLNGADLFVNGHPWAKDIGLVLNFEARGSGGPSYLLIETNQGNQGLVREFIAAQPEYPVGNSLAYSIYKMLPNDTDLTVFREDQNIQGFNFAFIDDHFDYHTVLDSRDRLDPASLAHQGSYLMPLLHHFSRIDLSSLKSGEDSIYFNIPLFRLLAYPYSWIWPMLFLAILCFIALLIYGLYRKELDWKGIGRGFLAALQVLIYNGLLGYFSWSLISALYPGYEEILQGFPYNGHMYIAAFTLLSLAICFWTYRAFRKERTANLLVAPIFIWLMLCTALAAYLPGASFFIIPVFALLATLLILIHQKEGQLLILLFLGIPGIWMLAPLVQMFPVGLGLKMLISSTLLTTLLFFLLLPVWLSLKNRFYPGGLCFLLFIGFMAAAHFTSDFSPERPLPTSLLYVLDADRKQAEWASYDHQLSDWTAPYFGKGTELSKPGEQPALSSKYGTPFQFRSEAPLKQIDPPQIKVMQDSVVGTERTLQLQILPQRRINRLEIHTEDRTISRAFINDVPLDTAYLRARRGSRLVTHYVSDNAPTTLRLTLKAGRRFDLVLYEASHDLLNHPLFSIPQRPQDQIPKPFVLNDAILIRKTLSFE